MPETDALSPRFTEALVFATMLHRGQVRKSTPIPYISHPLGVASLVLENGGSEDEAIAALLHDAVEDCGGLPTLERIRDAFGDNVAAIVRGCTDSHTSPKPPWLTRKKAYLEHLASATPSVRLVSCADKIHNARAILTDLRIHGEPIWERFNAGKIGTLWYYRKLANTFGITGPCCLAGILERTVAAIEEVSNGGGKVLVYPLA